MLVNLNYRIGGHINFAQSRIPALVCSPQSKYGCHQARSKVGQLEQSPPNSKIFRLISEVYIVLYTKPSPESFQ